MSSRRTWSWAFSSPWVRSEEHTSELQSQSNIVCRLLLEKKNLMLRLQIHPPFDRKLKLLPRLLQRRDSVPIAHPLEIRLDEPLHTRAAVLIKSLVSKLQV